MTFLWPKLLWLLPIFIPLIACYFVLRRRKSANLSRYPGLIGLQAGYSSRSWAQRHVPALLLLLGLVLLALAFARPTAEVTLPSRYDTVLLAVDVSGSMKATDVAPDRIGAAKVAIRKFVEKQAASTRIGVVAFASTAALVQAPTSNRTEVLTAIDKLQLQGGTAIGSGLLIALKTIFPTMNMDLGTADFEPKKEDGATDPLRVKPAQEPVAPGSYKKAAIILLTDGQATTGPDPIKTAQVAAERGLRVYTVGVGTHEGQTVSENGWSMRVFLDEDTLVKIAKITQGEYFHAGSEEELTKAYQKVTATIAVEKKELEITALFAAAAAFLTLLSAMLSMLWFHRIL